MEAPSSILTYPGEEEYLHRDLDLAYVDRLALDLARILTAGQVAEASYEPGDMTRYRVVVVPLSALRAGQARVSPRGSVGGRHAVAGMKRSGGDDGGHGAEFYADHAYLVCVGDRCYSMWLEPGGGAGIAPSYLVGVFDLPPTSAVSVAVLLRAVCAHLATCVPDGCTGYRDPDRPGDGVQHDGDTCPVHEGARAPWHGRIGEAVLDSEERPHEDAGEVEVLLAGLEVESVSKLRRLVVAAREGVVVTPWQARAVASMFAAPDLGRDWPPRLITIEAVADLPPGERAVSVRLRNGRIGGSIHAEPTDDESRACLFSADVTRKGGNLGISYETLMDLPDRGPDA